MEGLTDLFADSSSSGKLANFSLTDFGPQLKKAQLSFGNVPLGIYKRGPRKKPAPLFHDEQTEKEIYQLVANLKSKSHYYASSRNFKNGVIMNFTNEDFAYGLYFLTFTFNWKQKDLRFSFAPWRSDKSCPIPNCQQPHIFQTIPTEITTFLAEKRIAKKIGRELDGVNDLFATAIQNIHKIWKPTNFKYVAVPELHKCQTPCHWQGKKTKKRGWKNHDKNCACSEKHDCLRNWHIHMLCTDFLPAKYQHPKCGLGQFSDAGSPSGCWDHRAYIAHDIWPYGLVDMKRVSHLRVGGKPIRSAEGVVLYLIKYLAKSFQMRQDKELATRVGLLPGMSIYKFFKVIYGYENGQAFIQQKRKKPLLSSQVFINNDYGFQQEVEQEFSPYFDEKGHLKKDARKILQKKEPQPVNNHKITDLLKLCLRYSTKSKIKQNQLWKPCDTSEESTWKKGQGWKVQCPITKDHHTEPIIRWEFSFNGKRAYADYQKHILPNLSRIKLPVFTKFQDYSPQDADFIKFAHAAKLPWNKRINEYEPLEECGESADEPGWRQSIPPELIYNHIYLKEIRSQISSSGSWVGLSADDAIKRYADY
ncbi:MAG: hypothetical protein MRERV_14c063 [Mycoplasmataceae bacterium RV_VA103A]|nr:MAG: hypothetical protein MRERV_21c018 [Mycoplasmataceae bacterium RV_VA103A]KLL04709.1 MAG: hypothetical protein MRERV_14c063 [Mycoplasmataceae bacterium RV_VA103A]